MSALKKLAAAHIDKAQAERVLSVIESGRAGHRTVSQSFPDAVLAVTHRYGEDACTVWINGVEFREFEEVRDALKRMITEALARSTLAQML